MKEKTHQPSEKTTPNFPKLVGYDVVAKLLGVSKATLYSQVCRGQGPPFIRFNRRRVAFDLNELRRWIDARRNLTPDAVVALDASSQDDGAEEPK